jgi:hypothetical protein
MTQQHPITPPPELVEQWCEQLFGCPDKPEIAAYELVRLGAQWGADQELEALLVWLRLKGFDNLAADLLAARRPKPPSLKEQALDELDGIAAVFRMSHGGNLVCDTIRRALEALPE